MLTTPEPYIYQRQSYTLTRRLPTARTWFVPEGDKLLDWGVPRSAAVSGRWTYLAGTYHASK